jgi:hypothetical protein
MEEVPAIDYGGEMNWHSPVPWPSAAAAAPCPNRRPPVSPISPTSPPRSVSVVLDVTPYYPLSLESCPDLILADWEPVAADIPTENRWAFTNVLAADATPRFYRAFHRLP